ncbi:MAG: DUF4143 domain-containing protein, partial [bacterium]|nr:DUF4143 domain-containing protein [bacterium]
ILELLTKAQICHKVYHSPCAGVPLFADFNENTYKLIFMDIGIVNHLCGINIRTIGAFTDTAPINEGSLAEQFIGQHLISLKHEPPRLCYWLREGKTANAEVDYVPAHGMMLVPVEVKAGKSGSLKSLQQIILHRGLTFAVRFDANPPSLQEVQHMTSGLHGTQPVAFTLLSLPLYMVEECIRLIELVSFR